MEQYFANIFAIHKDNSQASRVGLMETVTSGLYPHTDFRSIEVRIGARIGRL